MRVDETGISLSQDEQNKFDRTLEIGIIRQLKIDGLIDEVQQNDLIKSLDN